MEEIHVRRRITPLLAILAKGAGSRELPVSLNRGQFTLNDEMKEET